MINILQGFRIAILITNGFQYNEMMSPRQMLEEAGAVVHIVSDKKTVTGWDCDIPKVMMQLKTDVNLNDAHTDDYDALLIPGGYGSPEELRVNQKAIRFVKGFAKKPIAAICHGPMLLIDANLVKNKKITSYPAVKQDLINAGAHWIDKAAVTDGNLVTSRSPDDLADFNKAVIDLFADAQKKKLSR